MQDSDRLTLIEERLAHQDRIIEDMSAVLASQWQQIERLTRQLQAIDDQIAAVEHLARAGRAEPPPPHF